MLALVTVLGVIVALMGVLVAGLLRSHADILKALHDLGAGVGDPAERVGGGRSMPITIGPPRPGERSSSSAPVLAGVTPGGDALALAVGSSGHFTLLAFLSSGCATCAGFWEAFARPDQRALLDGARLVVVTKGPEMEISGEVQSRAGAGVEVVMSTDAWGDYDVPGSPFFVLVDGHQGRRIGEGAANHFHQVADLVKRARVDAEAAATTAGTRASPSPSSPGAADGGRSRSAIVGLDGPAREAETDHLLLAAGVLPGDASLYPRSLEDLYGPGPGSSALEAQPGPFDSSSETTGPSRT